MENYRKRIKEAREYAINEYYKAELEDDKTEAIWGMGYVEDRALEVVDDIEKDAFKIQEGLESISQDLLRMACRLKERINDLIWRLKGLSSKTKVVLSYIKDQRVIKREVCFLEHLTYITPLDEVLECCWHDFNKYDVGVDMINIRFRNQELDEIGG